MLEKRRREYGEDVMFVSLKSLAVFLSVVTALVLGSTPFNEADAVPIINSISGVNDQQVQTIDVRGSGFGTLAPYTGDTNHIILFDFPKFTAGFAGFLPFNCCIPGQGGFTNDLYTLAVNLWSDTEIILGG